MPGTMCPSCEAIVIVGEIWMRGDKEGRVSSSDKTSNTDLVDSVVDGRHVHGDVGVVLHKLVQACSDERWDGV